MCEMANYMFKVEVLLPDINDIFIHRVSPVDMCFKKFNKTLSERYKILTKSKFIMMWIDAEDDLIRIFNESDFKLFVELKGTKIYVINESMWDEWNDRRAPQNNGNIIEENYSNPNADAETIARCEDVLDYINSEDVAHERETTDAGTNFKVSEVESVVLVDATGNGEKPVPRNFEWVQHLNEISDKGSDREEACRNEIEKRTTEIEKTIAKANSKVPEPTPDVLVEVAGNGEKSAPRHFESGQHLNEISDQLANNITRTFALLKDFRKPILKVPEPAAEFDVLPDVAGNSEKPVPRNFESGQHLNEISDNDSDSEEEYRNEIEKRTPEIEKTIAKTNSKVPEPAPELDALAVERSAEKRVNEILINERSDFKNPQELIECPTDNFKVISRLTQRVKEINDNISKMLEKKFKVPEPAPELIVFSPIEPKGKLLDKEETTDMRSVFKFPEAISEFVVSAKKNESQMESIFAKLPSAFTKRSGTSKGTWKKCTECGLFRSSSFNQHTVSSYRLPLLKGETCSSCGKHKRKEIKVEGEKVKTPLAIRPSSAKPNHYKQSEVHRGPFGSSTDVWAQCMECELYKSKTGFFHTGRSLVARHPEARTCPTCGGPRIHRQIVNVAGRPSKEILNNASINTDIARRASKEILDTGEKVQIPPAIRLRPPPEIPPRAPAKPNLYKQSEVHGGHFESSTEVWAECIECELFKSKVRHFLYVLSLVPRHLEGKTCPTCGGLKIDQQIFNVARRASKKILNNAFIDTGIQGVIRKTIKKEKDDLQNQMQPQTEFPLQKSDTASATNKIKYTGVIPKATSRLSINFKVNEAVNSLKGLGYKNVDGRLNRLVESVDGDVIEALELLRLLEKVCK